MTYNEMKAALEAGICKVVFTKVDGTERTMTCTRVPAIINESVDYSPSDRPSVSDESRMIVFDTAAEEFRTFRTNSVVIFNGVKQ